MIRDKPVTIEEFQENLSALTRLMSDANKDKIINDNVEPVDIPDGMKGYRSSIAKPYRIRPVPGALVGDDQLYQITTPPESEMIDAIHNAIRWHYYDIASIVDYGIYDSTNGIDSSVLAGLESCCHASDIEKLRQEAALWADYEIKQGVITEWKDVPR